MSDVQMQSTLPVNPYRLMFQKGKWIDSFLKVLVCSTLCCYGTAQQSAAAAPPNAKSTAANTLKKKSTTAKASPSLVPVIDETQKQALNASIQKLAPTDQANIKATSDAIHLQDRAVYNGLRDDEELSYSDIGMLWQAAVEHSSSIRYAIEKLSRKDATGKPVQNDNFSKRLTESLVHLGGVAGTMWTGTPAGLIGSNMLQGLMSSNPQDTLLSHVTDADMVILAKEVDGLQSRMIELYYNYRNAQARLKLAQEGTLEVSRYYDHALANEKKDASFMAIQPLLQSLYDSTKQKEIGTQQELNSARTELSLMVGPEAVAALEHPTSSNSPKSAISPQTQ